MKKITTIYLFILLFLSFGIKAQDVNNYAITAGSNESLDVVAGWTTLIGSNQIALSAVTNIGFDTWFMGERFTQFTVNTNGVLRFGGVALPLGANTSNILNNARICAFAGVGEDLDPLTSTRLWRTETNGQVRYKVTGTAPNRILVVDWFNMRMTGNAAATGISGFQVHVYETAPANADGGLCKIIYGRLQVVGYNFPTTLDRLTTRTGIGYLDGINPNTQRYLLINTNNHPSVAAANLSYGATLSNDATGTFPFDINLNSTTQGSRKYYNFNPPAPTQNVTFVGASCVSDNELLINWTAAAGNQVGYVVYRATAIAGPYDFIHQTTDATTSTYLDQLLTAGTTYYYRVLTVTEGKLSAITANNQVSAMTTVSPTVFSVISNNWTNTNTWSTTAIPLATENVIIGCRVPHTVAVNNNGVANDLTLETNSILNFNSNQTIVTEGNVTNKGTININGGTLRIKGNLINNAGATVNIQNGTLIVEGNFTNAATATLNGNAGTFALKGNFTNLGIYNSNTSIMRFDGTALQLINHIGTSSGQNGTISSNTYNNPTALVTIVPPGPIPIPDNNPAGISKIINFPTTASLITNVTLNLQITHTWVGDLIVTLTSPTGTVRTLIDRPGRTTTGFGCSGDNINVLLSDAAALFVEGQCAGTPTINGTFKPNETLAAFNGQNPTGNWTVTVSDVAGASTGSLVSGSLNITTTSGTSSIAVNSGSTTIAGLAIPDSNVGGVDHIINVPTAGTIQSIRMDIAIEHTYIGDLIVTLTNPALTTTRRMINRISCSGDNLSITFDDLAAASVQTQCGGGIPSINGAYRPQQTLNVGGFIGQNQLGDWKITISDEAGGDVGRVMSANLYITSAEITTFPLSSNLYFHKLEMQNTGAGVRTQNTDVHVLNTATWTNGVFRADNDHKIIFVDNATSTVGNNASHADMKVQKIGNDAFDFPVGNGGWGAPIGISAPSNVADYFTAQYFKQVTPNNPFSKEASIHHVGQCEYWILDKKIGSAVSVVVTLSYDNIRSCTVGPIAGLKVVRWDGAVWRDHFNGGNIAAPYNGVRSSTPITTFSPFTLGASTDLNILPLTFLSFNAKPFESDAILDWTTTGEKNHDYFEIERSISGQDFKTVGKVKNPLSRDATKNTYSFIDKNVGIENMEAYYRLKQIDNDGKSSYSDIKKVNWNLDNSKNEGLFVAYPNPFSDILILDFRLDKTENIEISLIDMTGRIIKTFSQSYSKGNHKVELNYLQHLAQGSYLLQFKTNTIQKTLKVVKM